MADDGLVDHSVSISSCVVVGSQGSSGSSLVSSTSLSSGTDVGLNASLSNKSSVGIVAEGAPPDGVEHSSTCAL
eukprot:3388555-Ditylum_brightwellii.AAC.1